MHLSFRAAVDLLLILIAGLFIYGWRLGDSPLDRTEPHRALVAHEMVQSGNWLIPRLLGEVYLRKPPLIYWAEAASESVFRRGNEFTWRLPSAVGSAALAVALALLASRWFGPAARFPAGIAALALIALWEQDRGADIDALNTVAAALSAMVILEICLRNSTRRWLWGTGLAIAFGSTLLLKGPGGLPPILGAVLGPAIFLRDWRSLRRPPLLAGLLGGAGLFTLYALLAKAWLHRHGIVADTAGAREAIQRSVLHSLHDVLPAVTAPLLTLLYALPVSLTIPFAWILVRRTTPPWHWRPAHAIAALRSSLGMELPAHSSMESSSASLQTHGRDAHATGEDELTEQRRRLIVGLLGTIACALMIWILAGNKNPRYEYVALPLLAPLVGAVAADGQQWIGEAGQALARNLLNIFCFLFAVATTVLSAKIWKATSHQHELLLATILAWPAALVASMLLHRRRGQGAGIAMLAVLMLLSIPIGDRKNIERQKKSAKNAGAQLAEIVSHSPAGDPPTEVGVASMVRDMPELFYYSHLPIRAFGETHLADLAADPCPRWVVLSENPRFPEYSTLTRGIPGAFPHGAVQLNMPDPRDKVYVGYYAPTQTPRPALHLVPQKMDNTETEE